MDNFYRENILDHYKHPRNFGKLNNPDLSYEEENVTCGDKIGIEINLTTNNRPARNASHSVAGGQLTTLKEIKFNGEGCAISMASASMLTEKVKNMEISKVMKMGKNECLELLGITLTPSRLKCALLPLEAIHHCLGLARVK